MIGLALVFLRAGGVARSFLFASCTALATGLLLVAVAMLRLPDRPREGLFNLVAEPGLRGGTTFATVLLVLPLLLMLYQVVRLGTATRERRLAALRLAGATPKEVRWLSAVEVGLSVTAGAAAGPLVYLALRALFGGQRLGTSYGTSGYGYARSTFALVPTSVAPSWWQTVALVAGVVAAGIVTGAMASRHVIASPLGVSRRQIRPAPRPWGLVPVGLGLVTAAAILSGQFGRGEASIMAAMLLVILGAIALAPWVAFRVGRLTAARTKRPARLVAAAHLLNDPRPAGRAAAAVGAIAVVSGGSAVMEADVFAGESARGFDPFFVSSFLLILTLLLLALLVTTSTLAIHAVESMIDRRRAMAGLVAAGTPVVVLRDSLRFEATLTALPLAFGGSVLGAVAVSAVDRSNSLVGLLIVLGQIVITILVTWLAIRVAVLAVTPWLGRATAPANLRTE
ncbi:MAG: FtsX-like permease family protein [Nocardioidaceae bacterium]